MARKVKDVTIAAAGRDAGKVFRLTEMSALAAEKWAARAILALGRSGVDIDDEFRQAGTAAIITVGLRAFVGIDFADAEPLMDEMMACVEFVPDPQRPDVRRKIISGEDGDIDEVETLVFLRGELMELHTGFTVRAALSTLGAALTEWMVSLLTRTSLTPSDASSEVDSPPITNLPPSTD